ncbi:MAG: SH3 domain-containing protein [Anaerolineaceae bacterium]|nr:SH3 domain-containing protein [Anaerolineaceae bacterium]
MRPQNRIVLLSLVVALMLGLVVSMPVVAQSDTGRVMFAQPKLVVNTSFLNVRTGPGVGYPIMATVVGGTELPVLGAIGDDVWYQVSTEVGPGWVNITFTLPRGDFTNVPYVDSANQVTSVTPAVGVGVSAAYGSGVTGVSLLGKDMYAQPDYDSMHVNTSVPNDPFTVYPLLDQRTINGTVWYLVSVAGVGTGWMDAVQIRILDCGPETVGVTTTETPIRFEGIANRDSYLLPPGVEGLLRGFGGVNNVYYRFEMADGTLGLVDVNAVAPRSDSVVSVCDNLPAIVNPNAALGQGGGGVVVQPIRPANLAIVNTGFLNIRTGPGAQYAIIATVPGGTELAVAGRASDDVWMLVEGTFGRGWINNEFILFRGDYSSVPVINDAVIITPGDVAALGQGGGSVPSVSSGRQVTGVSLLGKDMYAEPTYDSMHTFTSVPNDPGTIYPLLDQETVNGTIWYYVSIEGVAAGWMDAVQLRLLECGSDQVGVTVGEHPIRFDGIANRDSFLLPGGTEGYIVGRRGDFTIFELQDGTVGLVLAEVIVPREGVTSVCTGISSAAVSGTSTGSTTVNLVVTGNRVVVNTGYLNVRSGPSAGFGVVATVPGGTELAVVGRTADGVWFYVEGGFGRGWLNNQFVLFRGDYSTVPVITFGS